MDKPQGDGFVDLQGDTGPEEIQPSPQTQEKPRAVGDKALRGLRTVNFPATGLEEWLGRLTNN